jgi:hypothetical protein
VGKYVNAFTNSGGGEILFGVDDDGAVSGCVLAPEEMGQVTRLVDGATQRVDPQLDVDAVRCVYVPVVGPGSGPDPVPKPNLQPDFNMSVFECFDTSSSAGLRELDESDRSVQKSAESTSI